MEAWGLRCAGRRGPASRPRHKVRSRWSITLATSAQHGKGSYGPAGALLLCFLERSRRDTEGAGANAAPGGGGAVTNPSASWTAWARRGRLPTPTTPARAAHWRRPALPRPHWRASYSWCVPPASSRPLPPPPRLLPASHPQPPPP
eukprot:scaffold85454_cov49-Phaeocystis_antarctica.AAC.1